MRNPTPKSEVKPRGKESRLAAGKKRAPSPTDISPAKRFTLLWWLTKWSLVFTIWGCLVVGGVLAWFAWDLPAIDDLGPAADKPRRPSVTILAGDGSLIAGYGDLYGQRLTVNELPPELVQAVIAIEDRRFFDHPGVDLRGLTRAMVTNLRAGGIVQGGSTLTQQLAKNLFLTPERSYTRKIKELLLALALENKFKKNELLTIYLNRVYFGGGTYGVEAAAQRYFGTSARNVDIYQAAVLAGLLRAPSRLNPDNSTKAAHDRAVTVLWAMVAAGYLKPEEVAKIAKTQRPGRGNAATPRPRVAGETRRYFSDWALERAVGYAGSTTTDLAVETTLNPTLQGLAEVAVAQIDTKGAQVALVAMRDDGAVLAMVGGKRYGTSQFNRVTRALRQPGSAFKPIVYLPALEAGMSPESLVRDAPITVDGWTPRNYSGGFRGSVTLREAVALSLNTVAVRVSEDVGRDRVVQAARRLGITSPLKPHPSIALGAGEVFQLELAAAYAVFANGGFAVVPYGISEVRQGGKVVFRRTGATTRRVVSAEVAAQMTDMLRAVVDWGTGKSAGFGVLAAGKSGTSQDFRDAWFIGYAGNLVTAVWVGNDNNSPMDRVTGSTIPAAIWRSFMVPATNVGIAEVERRTPSGKLSGGSQQLRRLPERTPEPLDSEFIRDQMD
ncbi:MAG: PBP1A family penicillin-binding protein [Alphaproteobacteria bacterium]|nr:PBP1A family penicillin-binding protein [Alphaproteobacteria bacterium]